MDPDATLQQKKEKKNPDPTKIAGSGSETMVLCLLHISAPYTVDLLNLI